MTIEDGHYTGLITRAFDMSFGGIKSFQRMCEGGDCVR